MIRTSGVGPSLPVTAMLVALALALALVAIGACTVTPDAGNGVAATSQPSPTDAQPSPTATQPTATDEQPTQSPGLLPTPDPALPSAATTDPPDDQDDTDLAGTWVGTIESNGRTQGIRFVLRDLRSRGGQISGTALWESGKVDNGLRGTFDGDLLTLDDSLVNGINVYEGTVNGDVFTGTWTTVPRLEGQPPGTFEVTREE